MSLFNIYEIADIDLTKDEFDAWVVYEKSHPWLLVTNYMYESVLKMFISHFRRGINLNIKNESI